MRSDLRVFLHNARAAWILLTAEIILIAAIYASARSLGLWDLGSIVISWVVGLLLMIVDITLTHGSSVAVLRSISLDDKTQKSSENRASILPGGNIGELERYLADVPSTLKYVEPGNLSVHPTIHSMGTKNISRSTASVISVAHDIVAQVEPGELEFLFPAISGAYAREPGRLQKQRVVRSAPFAFAPGELVAVFTPTILLIVQQALVQMGVDATEKSAGNLVSRLAKRIFKRSASRKANSQPTPPAYTLLEIRDQAYKTAREFKVSEAKSKQIADVLVGRLATMKDE